MYRGSEYAYLDATWIAFRLVEPTTHTSMIAFQAKAVIYVILELGFYATSIGALGSQAPPAAFLIVTACLMAACAALQLSYVAAAFRTSHVRSNRWHMEMRSTPYASMWMNTAIGAAVFASVTQWHAVALTHETAPAAVWLGVTAAIYVLLCAVLLSMDAAHARLAVTRLHGEAPLSPPDERTNVELESE